MAKEEWGTKRVCPTTGKRFYDLNRDPVVSPYTGEVVELSTGKTRPLAVEKAAPKKTEDEDDAVVLEDEAETGDDVNLDDDVLDEDEDDANVSLDDLTDVASEDSDS